jgi:hypothetical protein
MSEDTRSSRNQVIESNLRLHSNGECLIWQGEAFNSNRGLRAYDADGKPWDVRRYYYHVYVPKGWLPHWKSTDECPSQSGRCLTEGHWELDVVREMTGCSRGR